MGKARRLGLIVLLVCSGVSVYFGLMLQRAPHGGIVDFRIVYLGARCLIEHRDPYNENEYLRVFEEQGGILPSDPIERVKFQHAVMAVVYLPTALMFVAPFAALGWGVAQALWTILTVGLLTLACCLVWDIASDSSPPIATCLFALMLANAEVLFAYGNAAGIAVSLCAIAVWCFVRERFPWAGVVCLAIALALKPHDSAAIWVFLLIAGRRYRNRALQSAVVFVVVCIPAVLWATAIAPHWPRELRSNVQLVSAPGGIADPGPAGISNGTGGMIISLQSLVSMFRDSPPIYNGITYAVFVTLVVLWVIATARRGSAQFDFWLGLATLVPISMLPVYHRPYDAKLLLLAIPACAALWTARGIRRWFALSTTSAALLLTSDIPVTVLTLVNKRLLPHSVSSWTQVAIVALARPIPLVLLAMSVFYLVVYLRSADRVSG